MNNPSGFAINDVAPPRTPTEQTVAASNITVSKLAVINHVICPCLPCYITLANTPFHG